MVNIVLVGAGKLGSRHLQAISQVKIKDTNIYVVDPSLPALDLARERFAEMPDNQRIDSVSYLTGLESLEVEKIDLAIIATTSEHRRSVVEEMCETCEVKNFILEKFLFQDENSYNHVATLLEKNEINTWVNCPRRQWPFYNELKDLLSGSKILQVDVVGTKWSIATSAIHFIDLISYLIEETEYQITHLDFGKDYVPAYSAVTGLRESKYVEFFGSIHGKYSNSTRFNFTCLEDESPFTLGLITNRGTINIFEESGQCNMTVSCDSGAMETRELNFSMPYQSQLTNLAAEEILLEGTCNLTPYAESARLHIPILREYLAYLTDVKNEKIEFCPIT